MNEIILSKSCLYYDYLPKISKVDNNILKKFINFNYKINSSNRFGDIKLGIHQHVSWVMNYIADVYSLLNKKSLIPLNVFGQINKKGKKIIKRNHVNFKDIKKCPYYTYLYCVDGKTNLTINYDDNVDKNKSWVIPIKTGKYVMWNSNLNYYLDNKNNNCLIIVNCQFV